MVKKNREKEKRKKSYIEVDKGDLHIYKNSCNRKRIRKANKRIYVENTNIFLKNFEN